MLDFKNRKTFVFFKYKICGSVLLLLISIQTFSKPQKFGK